MLASEPFFCNKVNEFITWNLFFWFQGYYKIGYGMDTFLQFRLIVSTLPEKKTEIKRDNLRLFFGKLENEKTPYIKWNRINGFNESITISERIYWIY